MKKTAKRFLTIALVLCMLAALMPAAYAREEVTVPDKPQPIDVELNFHYEGGGNYSASYSASMNISADFAHTVAVFHDKDKVLEDLRFDCILKGDLINLLDATQKLECFISDPYGVFEQVEGPVLKSGSEKSVVVTFKLKEKKIKEWGEAPAATVSSELQAEFTVSSNNLPVKADDLAKLGSKPIKTETQVDIYRHTPGRGVPLYGKARVEKAGYGTRETTLPVTPTGNLTVNVVQLPDNVTGDVQSVQVTLTDEFGKKYGPFNAVADASGRYTHVFDNLPYGTYNVLIEATLEDGATVDATQTVTVSSDTSSVTVTLPSTFLSTGVTGDVHPAVSGLDGALSEQEIEDDIEVDGDHLKVIDVDLEAKRLDKEDPEDKQIIESMNNAGNEELVGDAFEEFIDVTITKTITEFEKGSGKNWVQADKEEEQIDHTARLITLTFPLSRALRDAVARANAERSEGDPEVTYENILVYRQHGTETRAMRKVSASMGPGAGYECYYITTANVGGTTAEYITIKADQFSTYAFGVSLKPLSQYVPESTHYSVSFNSNGGSDVPSRSVLSGSELDLSSIVPTRKGYIFTGWYTDAELTDKVTSVRPSGDMTLYAGWQKWVADPKDTGVATLLNTDEHFKYADGVPGGLFAPGNNMTRKEVAVMFFNVLRDKTPVAPDFPDVPADEWYSGAVGKLASLDIIVGDENGKFNPDDYITRAEFAVFAMKFAAHNPGGENVFTDIEEGWYYDDVLGAVTYGWIEGKGDGIFDPHGLLTRAEAVTLMNYVLSRNGDVGYINSHVSELITFPDVPVNYWAYYNIAEATNAHSFSRGDTGETWTD